MQIVRDGPFANSITIWEDNREKSCDRSIYNKNPVAIAVLTFEQALS